MAAFSDDSADSADFESPYSRPFSWRTPQMVGQAGAYYVALELLKVGIVAAEPAVDVGYDLITDANGVLKRCQVKAQLEGNSGRPKLSQLRFNMRRRKAKFSGQNVTENRDRQYTAEMIDVMICVSLKFHKLFIVPAHAIDFRKDWLYYKDLLPWERNWQVLLEKTPGKTGD